MSYSIDVNLLLYASDSSCPGHARAREFIRACIEGPEVIGMAWVTIVSYVRIATHPSIFSSPMSHEEALSNVDSFMRQPQVRLLSEQDGFWETYREVTSGLPVRGNQVPDAHLAALLKQHGIVTLYTCDADFYRFRFLDVRNPLEVR
ncbi:MAG: PIN domain-containing protein [Candidatus Riflebacteria bacterium]|nr:PIN domain-containing protein [Candidatus Riflebacteria bacterium]